MTIKELKFPKEYSVLVTGGAGFIGSNLCEFLVNNSNKVLCLDNFVTGKIENISHLLKNKNFTLLEGDIRSLEDCKTACKNTDRSQDQ